MNNNLIKALRIIFSEEYNDSDPFAPLIDLIPSSNLMVFKKNQIIIEQNNAVKYFYLLLSGHASVVNSITWVADNNVDNVRALDILGLVEYLNNVPTYTAFVVALEECKVLRVSVEQYNQIIQQDVFLCYHTLRVLGRVTSENMNRAEVNSVFHPKEMLGHYLYFKAQSSGIPYTLPITRKELSEELHINLRTLYRYLSAMEENGTLELKHGKVIIDATHFKTLSNRYQDIIL